MPKYLKTGLTLAAVAILYFLYIFQLSSNPPAFYIDETLTSYNAYLLATTGRGEFGHFLPLYFPVLKIPPPHNFLGYVDPTQIYALAGLFLIFPPNYLLPRLLSATAMFITCLLLGRLAEKISGRIVVGIFTAATALVTPWLFESGRLAFGAPLYPLAIVLLLSSLYAAGRKDRWSLWNVAAIGLSLALTTYTYSIGRLLGPLLAVGLVVFITNRKRFFDVLNAWIVYAIALIPLAVFHLQNPGALTGRFSMTVGIIRPDKTWPQILYDLAANYLTNISPYRMLVTGDTNMRHHILDAPAVFLPTLVLAIAGIIIIFVYHRKEAFWRYVVFGAIVSVVPSSLTQDPFHMLRLIAVPVFLIMLMVPALMWLVKSAEQASQPLKQGLLAGAAALTLFQAVTFQIKYRTEGPTRGVWFDEGYAKLLETAIADPSRPIYLVDGYWGQAYAHAYWYAIVNGIDRSVFVHLEPGRRPPPGALVLSSEDKCTRCAIVAKGEPFLLYREGQ